MTNHAEIDIKNREIFKKKKILQKIYKKYFQMIKKNLLNKNQTQILEIGSSGFIKEIIPNCITSNLKKNDAMIDLKENIYDLKIKKNSISNLIMVDIFHHLEFPNFALKNIHDVLIPEGRVIMIEPAMGLIPRLIYKFFHHEPNGFNFNIKWDEIPSDIPQESSYFAAQSIPWRAFVNKELNLNGKFKIKKVKCFSDFAYLASGGFSYKSFYPRFFYNIFSFLDSILTIISKRLFSARMIIVLEKI